MNLSEGWQTAIFAVVMAPVAWGLIKWLYGKITRKTREKKVYLWLKENTENEARKQFKTTNEISQVLGIDEDQIRKICTLSKRIYQHSDREDLWGIYGGEAISIYEERGMLGI